MYRVDQEFVQQHMRELQLLAEQQRVANRLLLINKLKKIFNHVLVF